MKVLGEATWRRQGRTMLSRILRTRQTDHDFETDHRASSPYQIELSSGERGSARGNGRGPGGVLLRLLHSSSSTVLYCAVPDRTEYISESSQRGKTAVFRLLPFPPSFPSIWRVLGARITSFPSFLMRGWGNMGSYGELWGIQHYARRLEQRCHISGLLDTVGGKT